MTGSDPLLRILREYYGDDWHVRRTPQLWIATARDSTTRNSPTIIEGNVDDLVRQLEDPPARVGAQLAVRLFQSQQNDCGDTSGSPCDQ